MSEENDICKHCLVRGDLAKCLATECSQHDSWYAKQMATRPGSKPYKWETHKDWLENEALHSTEEEKLISLEGFNAARERKEG